MKVTPKTEEEIKRDGLLPPGTYSFEIVGTDDRPSKKGNDMITLKMKVFKPDGGYVFIDDYLLDSMAFKVRHAAEVCGLLADYEAGYLDHTKFVGKTGHVKVKIQKDKTGEYQDRNAIADYVRQESAATVTVEEDDLPF